MGCLCIKWRGKEKVVEREPRFIRINELNLKHWRLPVGGFSMSCSKGTYVTVFHDLGNRIGCGGHLIALRRTRIDQFSISDAKTLDEFVV